MANRNSNLIHAKKAKNDEFYTQLSDIENELRHYKAAFRDKTVLCNCDDPRVSNFTRYFLYNFDNLGLKHLISTCYRNSQPDLFSDGSDEKACYLDFHGEVQVRSEADIQRLDFKPLEGDGDFRSEECIEFLKQADIVCTNPPFSLFREYVTQLMEYGRQFVILGNMNAITYKEIFPLIKDNKLWLGMKSLGSDMYFNVKDDYKEWLVYNKKRGSAYEIINGVVMGRMASACWYTNIDIPKRHEELILCKSYYKNPELYPKYDNYDAINVDKVADIPYDYLADIGVPVTYLDKHNPDQFEIIDANDIRKDDSVPVKPYGIIKDKEATITIPEPLTQPDEMAEPSAAGSRQQAAGSRQQAAGSRQQAAGSGPHTPESSSGGRCNGIMGVPITFLDKYNPEQFEIIGNEYTLGIERSRGYINGKRMYSRIFIRQKV